jgi:cyanophycinase-like exopeptidase
MKKLYFLLFPIISFSQGYTSYFTGNTTNITTTPEFGVCMMGGATENDNAMTWLLQKANGGDVVVLRSTGSNGYNNYLYSGLGVTVNSVETLVITSAAGATNPYVLDKVSKAEMIWFAGGDQWNYVSYFKNNALEDLINYHVNVKGAPIGGTSAGMAILGGRYFSAQNGSVTSAQAMSNPYATNVTLAGYSGTTLPTTDFLNIPFLTNVITDTHYDNPDRRGRHATFMARFKQDYATEIYGIACNEYVAVCIGTDGRARVYGDYPNYQEFAYFIQPNCFWGVPGPYCVTGQPLTWNSIMVYKVPGTMNGDNYFDVSPIGWGYSPSPQISGGSWETWNINNGVLSVVSGGGPSVTCMLDVGENEINKFSALPNPFTNSIYLENAENAIVEIYDSLGKKVFFVMDHTSNAIDTSQFSNGLYFVKIQKEGNIETKKMIKK